MSLLLSEHLPLIASAPGGIQKLRSLILELAVLGKLHHNGPNCKDEAWKTGLFSDFFTLEYGDNLPAPKRSGTGEYPVYGSNGVVGTHSECRVTAPCIVVGRKGSAGALNCCRESGCWVTDVAYYCVPPASIDLDFTLTLFQTLGLDQLGKGIKPGLSRSEAYSLSVAIPPINEQLCIVAKVGELMAICDRLESEQNDSATAHTQLIETLLGTLTHSCDTADFETNWQRIAKHFDTLFTTEASIDALQKLILQLAVTGKLVSQDPMDEPASELLTRINAIKINHPSNSSKRKAKATKSSSASTSPYSLPTGWVWAPLSDLTQVLNGRAYSKAELLDSGTPVLRVGNLFTSNQWYYSNLNLGPDKYCDAGDLIYSWSASFGPFIWPGPKVIYHYHIWKLTLFDETSFSKAYFYKYLLEKTAAIKAAGHGVSMIHMTKEKMEKLPVPVPPIAEQQRIVAKVDELMAVCDRLKAQISASKRNQTLLAGSLISAALSIAA